MSAGANGLALLLLALAAGVAAFGGPDVAGLPRDDLALALALTACGLHLTGRTALHVRAGAGAVLSAAAIWAVGVALLATTFLHREAMVAGFGELRETLAGPEGGGAVVASGGEVSIIRRRDGHFSVPASVNGETVRFVFDTGATTVVLTSETARRLGLSPEGLRFRVPVATANGRALAAPVTLDRLAVGPIVVRRVPALVAQPGLLDGDLLGQTFLDRLESYEVRGNRLVMRARNT